MLFRNRPVVPYRSVQPFDHALQVGFVLFVTNRGIFGETSARQFGTTTTICPPLLPATAIDGALVVAGIRQPKDLSLDNPASPARCRIIATLGTYRTTGRRVGHLIFPQPPFAFAPVRVLGIDKIRYGPVEIKLTTVDSATSQATLLDIQLLAALTAQRLYRGIPHGQELLLGPFPHIGYLTQFGHNCLFLFYPSIPLVRSD